MVCQCSRPTCSGRHVGSECARDHLDLMHATYAFSISDVWPPHTSLLVLVVVESCAMVASNKCLTVLASSLAV